MTSDSRLAALERLYRDRYTTFLRVAYAITADEEAARDAVHDGFVRAVRDRRTYRASGPLEAWVWRIVVNEARKRRASDARARVRDPARMADERSTNGSGGDARVRGLVAALPERQRLVLFLRYYADLDYAAIASALGIAEGTVAATLNAARATLRTRLTEVSP